MEWVVISGWGFNLNWKNENVSKQETPMGRKQALCKDELN